MTTWRVAADVGGTFTDIVAVDEAGNYYYLKLPSTPGRFEAAVFDGLDRVLRDTQADGGAVERLVHGTTVATNAILERSGPVTGLVTTRGFRDVVEIGRLRIPNSYDMFWTKPVPLAARRHRVEADERVAADGSVLAALVPESMFAGIDAMVGEGVTTIAISFINSYINPVHEDTAARLIAERHPRVFVTRGVDVVRELGEYERTSTAVINAYLKPVVSAYFERLLEGLSHRGVRGPTLIMQSSGGMMPISEARLRPAQILESGPAAGAIAAARVAARAGLDRAIAFDMGGTTAKATLIEDFELVFGNEFTVGSEISAMSRLLRGGGYAVRLPAVDLAEVGAGGGSIAHVDAAGGLEVGPQSAGAEPGPACYRRGGQHATVTDANLLLGYLSPEGLLRGGIEVDAEGARAALQRDVAGGLGLSLEDAAHAVHAVADQRMGRVIRAVSTERGRDAASYSLIAFGGSGPLHAASLAEAVGIRTVVIPPLAGVLSAVGLLWSPIRLTQVGAVELHLPGAAAALPGLLERLASELLERLKVAGFASSAVVTEVALDMRFVGQAYELSIPVGNPARIDPSGLLVAFTELHRRTYGHGSDAPVEVIRARVSVRVDEVAPSLLAAVAPPAVPVPTRHAWFGGREYIAPVVTRRLLEQPFPGPCLVDDTDTTTVVPPGWTVRRDEQENLILERAE